MVPLTCNTRQDFDSRYDIYVLCMCCATSFTRKSGIRNRALCEKVRATYIHTYVQVYGLRKVYHVIGPYMATNQTERLATNGGMAKSREPSDATGLYVYIYHMRSGSGFEPEKTQSAPTECGLSTIK